MLAHARSQHADLHRQVSQLERSVGPTSFNLVEKKKKKLLAKEEVIRLEEVLAGLMSPCEVQAEVPLAMASG